MSPEGSEQALARRLRLRGDPPPVARLSRRTIVLLAGGAAVTVAGLTAWGLAGRTPAVRKDAAETPPAVASAPQQVTALPKDYAALPPDTPKLGAPLPGDLGRPLLAAATPAAASPGDPNRQASEEQAQEEVKQARSSRLFEGASAPGAPRDASPQVTPTSGPSAPVAKETSVAAPTGPEPGEVLQAGSVIRAALITGVRSEIPGPVVAQVTENVFDSATGRSRLIPQGSRLIGSYDSQPAFGQSRAAVVWTRLILPDGRSVDLQRQPAADPEGYAGLGGRVDRHWREIAGAAAVSMLLGVGAELGVGSSDNQLLQALRLGAAGSLNQAGSQLVGKTLEVRPTLTLQPGAPVRVLLTRDLVLQPWEGVS